jgi:hypothetical protein
MLKSGLASIAYLNNSTTSNSSNSSTSGIVDRNRSQNSGKDMGNKHITIYYRNSILIEYHWIVLSTIITITTTREIYTTAYTQLVSL